MQVGEEILFDGIVYIIINIDYNGNIQLKRRD